MKSCRIIPLLLFCFQTGIWGFMVPVLHTSQTGFARNKDRKPSSEHRNKERSILYSKSSENDGNKFTPDVTPITKASWYAVETFGKIFAKKDERKRDAIGIDQSRAPTSLKETLIRIQNDNERSYFLSGEVDKLIYDEECLFSDPFVAFSGRDRFVENLQNLGSFVTTYSAKTLKYTVSDDGLQVQTKVMVKLELNLPWKPILAWPWGVTYNIDAESCLVTDHAESWDIKPLDGVKQIFRKPVIKID